MGVVEGHIYELSLKGVFAGVQTYNVFQYESVATDITISGADLAEAWWNHIKTVTRALYLASWAGVLSSVLAKDVTDPTGAYGEYGIPVGESAGTRADPVAAMPLPSFNAVGVRFSVGTRVTRPGQKRLSVLTESDSDGQLLGATMTGLVEAWADVMTAPMLLGVPALALNILPVVARKNAAGVVTASQMVTGYVVNPRITSQVSRKFGRGV